MSWERGWKGGRQAGPDESGAAGGFGPEQTKRSWRRGGREKGERVEERERGDTAAAGAGLPG